MDVRGSRSQDEIERFLTEQTVPVRVSCRTPSADRNGESDTDDARPELSTGPLWMLSLWYRYEDGAIRCSTAESADVVRYLRRDPGVAFEISTNEPPYRGVRGNGTAEIDHDPDKELLRNLLDRYLGTTDSQLARRLLDEKRSEVTITIAPNVVYGWDYTDQMSDS